MCNNMDFKYIMLSEISQMKKIMYCMIPFIWYLQKMQIYRDKR